MLLQVYRERCFYVSISEFLDSQCFPDQVVSTI